MVVRRIHLPSVRLGYHPEQEHPSLGGDKTASPSHATDVHGPTGRTNSDHMPVTGRHPWQLRLQLGQEQPHPQPILGAGDGGRPVSLQAVDCSYIPQGPLQHTPVLSPVQLDPRGRIVLLQ
ncbi:hypothetical protein CEXT_156591 [Caerostris extrusa]|uniref:Uncharacterized protein n=1 Tax=Caerostris extrusa TaxID=172846 RepID=A0AAV4XBV8_CAEEX|nr:hypothetical protein CEXT_156591 [Caerostris extrusa]